MWIWTAVKRNSPDGSDYSVHDQRREKEPFHMNASRRKRIAAGSGQLSARSIIYKKIRGCKEDDEAVLRRTEIQKKQNVQRL